MEQSWVLSLILAFPLQGESSGVAPAEAPGPVPAPASSTHFVLRVPAVVFVKHFEIL